MESVPSTIVCGYQAFLGIKARSRHHDLVTYVEPYPLMQGKFCGFCQYLYEVEKGLMLG